MGSGAMFESLTNTLLLRVLTASAAVVLAEPVVAATGGSLQQPSKWQPALTMTGRALPKCIHRNRPQYPILLLHFEAS